MEKKDLKHLSRSELVDVICEMKKDTTNSNDLTMEEIESEQKRLKDRAVYRKTLKGTIGILVVVAAISVLVATLWMPVLSIYGYSMSPTLEQGQYVVSVKKTDLKSGDIVAFWQGNKLLVKRVIAGCRLFVVLVPGRSGKSGPGGFFRDMITNRVAPFPSQA